MSVPLGEHIVVALIPASVSAVVSWIAFLHIRAAKLEVKSEVEAGLKSLREDMASAADMARLERRLERMENFYLGVRE